MRARETCTCCGLTEGVEHESVIGTEVDPESGLCLYCQQCPRCGQMGTACWDDGALGVCYGDSAPRCPVHCVPEPCPTCSAYIAAGL